MASELDCWARPAPGNGKAKCQQCVDIKKSCSLADIPRKIFNIQFSDSDYEGLSTSPEAIPASPASDANAIAEAACILDIKISEMEEDVRRLILIAGEELLEMIGSLPLGSIE